VVSCYGQEVLARIRALCEADPEREACGFVIRRGGGLEVIGLPNVADRYHAADPAQFLHLGDGLPDADQAGAAAGRIDDHIRHRPVQGLGEPWRYRNKMEFTFGTWDGEVVLGLHERGSFWKIVES